MSLPRGVGRMLAWFAPADRADDLLGDLEEVHRTRIRQRGRTVATGLTYLEALEMAGALVLARVRRSRTAPVSWIDVKLGVRMLGKHPGLTLVGGAAMAFAIFVGTACFEFYSQVVHPTLPFEEGERVVDLRLLDTRTREPEWRVLHDFAVWRDDLTTVEDLGAARSMMPNLAVGQERGEPIRGAAVTASTFRMARVPPLMGRALVEADERADAPDAVVIGHDTWRSRFGGDPKVVGRSVRLGGIEHTVVGVMPDGFGFPASEEVWVALRIDATALHPLAGPGVLVFGRLVPGATVEHAQGEVESLVARTRAERPDAYDRLHPRVMPYAEAAMGITDVTDRLAIMSVNAFALIFLVLVCGNVALLMFARVAAREQEVVVRTALGASRGRIVWQLFAEAMALAAVAGFVGVTTVEWGLERFVQSVIGGMPAFWLEASLSPTTVLYAVGLTVVGAAVAGVLPALKITSNNLESRLRRTSAGGGGLRFGGVWTAVIVVQVAATVTFPVVGWFVRRDAVNIRAADPGVVAEEYLTAGLRLNREASSATSDSSDLVAHGLRFARTIDELIERVEAEPGVKGATLAASVPGRYHDGRRIEVDGGGEAPRNEIDLKGPGRWINGGKVAPDYFEVLGVEAIEGRLFNADDAEPDARTVVVNRSFMEQVLGGRNPVGRRLRYVGSPEAWDGVRVGDPPGPWYRIVGVVPDLGMSNGASGGRRAAGFYHAVSPESLRASTLIVHADPSASGLASRLREIAAEVEPDLALVSVQTLDRVKDADLRLYGYWMKVIVGVCGLAVVLSLAGIYAVMSFTVARRTREIGVRVALGAGPAHVTGAIFRRPLLQVAAGIALGFVASLLLGWGSGLSEVGPGVLLALGAYVSVMAAVCLLACLVPVMKALAVEPREALAADG